MLGMRKVFSALEQSRVNMIAEWKTPPEAIMMVSGLWESDTVEVMSSPKPPMVYDYYNFPKETYEVVYPADGAPVYADRACDHLQQAGFEAKLNTTQGYDHGVFVPMAAMYPKADIPLFQVSILKSYDPEIHFEMGRALAALRRENVMIIGSGLSYHNLRHLGPEAAVPSSAFDVWLNDVMALPSGAHTKRLLDWESAPYARMCHPEEDHLVPLFVALGEAEDDIATNIYQEAGLMGGISASGFRFGSV